METSSLAMRWGGGRSRFSKALPEPPLHRKPLQQSQVIRPVRKDSLPPRPALPPKDTVSDSIPSSMTTKVMDAPLPALPSLTRVNSPPTVIPKRKPVGSGVSVKSASVKRVQSPPPSQPIRYGEISPVDSFQSLWSAYGTEDSGTRYSVDTTATKHSAIEPSPPTLPPKDSLVAGTTTKLDILSPLSLSSPLSSQTLKMAEGFPAQQQVDSIHPSQQYGRQPPTPPTMDYRSPESPELEPSLNTVTTSPTSLSNQSPSKPQIWRRRSLKSDKPLTVPELKLTLSHGSTAAPEQVTGSVDNKVSSQSIDNHSSHRSLPQESPILNGFEGGLPGRNIKPTTSQKSLPQSPAPEKMGNKSSKENLEGFSRKAQDSGHDSRQGRFKTPEYSPAKISPDTRRPPTPEYAKNEANNNAAIYSPASPMTPPQDNNLSVQKDDDMRPLSMVNEDPSPAKPARSTATAAPTKLLPGLPTRTTSRPEAASVTAPRQPGGLPRSPRPINSSSNATATPSPAATPATLNPSPMAPSAPVHTRSTSSTSAPTIAVSDDGDALTIKGNTSPPPSTVTMNISSATITKSAAPAPSQQPKAMFYDSPVAPTSPTSARPGDPSYFPMRHYLARPIAPGTVLAAPALKPTQLSCFAGHYRFVAARNEGHPVACATCSIADNAVRFSCSHCNVRVCKDCCDVLMLNGRDVGKLVEMLRA